MKKLFLLLVFLKGMSAFAQQVVVANEKMNIVYAGVDNPLSAAVSGYPCNTVTLTTDNGKIEKVDCGKFNYVPEKANETKIKVWVKSHGALKQVGEWTYRVRLLPDPVAILIITDDEGRMRPWSKDSVYKSFVRATMSGIRVISMEPDYEALFKIISYSIKIARDTVTIYSEGNIGSRISYQKIVPLDKLKNGDHLIFYNIKCAGSDRAERIIAPLEFIIKE
jgi:hypothetical protein